MRLGSRIIATMAVAILLAPTLYADDTAKPAARAKRDEAVNSRLAPGVVAKAKLAATTAAPLPAAPVPHLTGTDSNTPKAELYLGYSYWSDVPRSPGKRIVWAPGGSASLALNFNRYVGLVGEINGYRSNEVIGIGTPVRVVDGKGTVLTYLFGPRLSYRKNDRITPFAQFLFGGAHAGEVTLTGCTGTGCTPLPSENVFAMSAGGGLDIKVHPHVALRIIQAEYLWTQLGGPSSTGVKATQNNVRLSAGIVFRFGGNPPPPPPPNHPPVASCSADKSMVYVESGDVVAVRAQASDPDNDPLTYSWTASGGTIEGSGPEVRWNSSGTTPRTYTVRVRVDDGRGGTADCSADIRVEPRPNRPPTMSCSADRSSVVVGEPVQITATASDPDNDPLTFSWSTSGGRIIGSQSSVRLDTSGLAPGRYTVTGRVDDGRGGTADCAMNVDAQAPPPPPEVKQLEQRLALHSIYFQTARPSVQNPTAGLVATQQDVLVSLADDFKRYLTFKPDAHLILGGHADLRGSSEYNKALTQRRVERTKNFLVEHGVPPGSIETQSFGKEENLDADQVRQLIERNPDLSAEDRQKILSNLKVIVMANNRRVDVSLSTTGQQSVRQFPFNARDSLNLISPKAGGTDTRTRPAAKKKTKKQ